MCRCAHAWHRDVRWENVIHAGPGARSSWVLLDLETVWAAGEVRMEGPGGARCFVCAQWMKATTLLWGSKRLSMYAWAPACRRPPPPCSWAHARLSLWWRAALRRLQTSGSLLASWHLRTLLVSARHGLMAGPAAHAPFVGVCVSAAASKHWLRSLTCAMQSLDQLRRGSCKICGMRVAWWRQTC